MQAVIFEPCEVSVVAKYPTCSGYRSWASWGPKSAKYGYIVPVALPTLNTTDINHLPMKVHYGAWLP